MYFLNFQEWPENSARARQMGFDVENETYMRLVRLAKVKQANIQVSDETLAHLARRLLGPKISLDAFVREYLLPHGITEEDFERFLRHDAAIQQLGAVAGLPGKLIPPREIDEAYQEEYQEVSVQGVFFNVSNYLSHVAVNETNVLHWYSNNMALFRVPEKVQVSYVEFNRTNFAAEVDKRFAQITNLNEQLEQLYLKEDPSSFKDKEGKVLSKEAAIQKIKDTEKEKAEMVMAARQANEFASKLYDQTNHTEQGFEKFVASEGYKTHLSAPFDEYEGPQDLQVSDKFAHIAFSLTNQTEAIAFQPMQGADAYYVFALKNLIPSTNPSFESIRSKVIEQYRFAEAQKIVRQTGLSMYFRMTNALAHGESFDQVVTNAHFKPVQLPTFSRSTRELPGLPENVSLRYLQNVAFSLKPGEASRYIPSMDGGFILYLKSKLKIDPAKMKEELPQFAAVMRSQRQNRTFGLWFQKQAERADLPFNNRTQGRQGSSAPRRK